MSTPRKPGDPAALKLKPSAGANKPAAKAPAGTAKAGAAKAGTTKADFSKVKSSVTSTEAPAPKADFSKVQSSVSSTEQAVGATTYTVRKGDTLSHIAKAHYGRASQWKRIFEANRDQLDDPDLIKPGQVLKIPPADA
jgi:nucleoid-associated protein YgaU